MKFLMIFFMLTLLVQAVPVEACDMEEPQETSHHQTHEPEVSHDCCDPGEEESSHSCDTTMHCGSCAIGLSLALLSNDGIVPESTGRLLAFAQDPLATAFSHPPFRPPIS